MITFPNCKINLGLRIGKVRADGYHNLASVFYPVLWCDALEMVQADDFDFKNEGIKIEGPVSDNICVKAFQLMQNLYAVPPVKMILLKNIPSGAGLGGGSADGAFALMMLNDLFRLQLPVAELKKLALQLGSDCPFFIENKPMFVTGKGEQLAPIDINLSGYYLLIVYPPIGINTAWAFREYDAQAKTASGDVQPDNLIRLINMPPEQWQRLLVNDFETVINERYPEVALIKKQLYDAGAVYASMSGSGSAVYGLFRHQPRDVTVWKGYRFHTVKLA